MARGTEGGQRKRRASTPISERPIRQLSSFRLITEMGIREIGIHRGRIRRPREPSHRRTPSDGGGSGRPQGAASDPDKDVFIRG